MVMPIFVVRYDGFCAGGMAVVEAKDEVDALEITKVKLVEEYARDYNVSKEDAEISCQWNSSDKITWNISLFDKFANFECSL
jgi:hypothetical protein